MAKIKKFKIKGIFIAIALEAHYYYHVVDYAFMKLTPLNRQVFVMGLSDMVALANKEYS